MPTAPTIHVRPLEVADFSFVRDLAAKQPNFTIPPPYVLWLLLKIKGDICLIAQHETHGPVAYVLAVPIDTPPESLYVWQLAASDLGKRHQAVHQLLLHLRETTGKLHMRSLIFSALPGSAAYRAFRRYAWRLSSARPRVITALPGIVAPNEIEFRIDLR